MKLDLDAMDAKILDILQSDARTTLVLSSCIERKAIKPAA